MKSLKGEFVRKIGCLNLAVIQLNRALKIGDLIKIEEQTAQIQESLIDLIKMQRRLTRTEQQQCKPHFANAREDAISVLEIARRLLDDSLEAMMILIKTVQDSLTLTAPIGRQP